jgi:transposase
VTVCAGRRETAFMTPPPPASPGLRTGNREKRRRAPVSDRPGASPGAAGSSLPVQGGPLLSLSVPEAVFYVGIDWAAETHAVCVMDLRGKVVARFTVAHSAEGLEKLVRKLAGLGDPADMPAALERPSGVLVDALLEAGHPVVPVSPNAIKTWRESEVLSGAKSDPGDAEVIAEYLRLRQHRLRVATPYSDGTRALRTLTRARDDVVDLRVAAVNQLGALLDAHWPGGKAIFADLESKIALEFLTRYPTAHSAGGLGEEGIAAFCREMGYSGKRPAAVLLARLHSAPTRSCGGALTTAVRDAVLALVTVVKTLTAATRDLDRSVTARLGEHPDGKIFTSLPRSGQINAAQMLAEWGDCRPAYDGPDAVAALAGVTPVTKESGKHRAVHFRWACNKRFRRAVTIFADNSRHASPWAAHIYNQARASGKDHPHAIRILARAWIRVIWACWLNGIPYDPGKHGAAAALIQHAEEKVAA